MIDNTTIHRLLEELENSTIDSQIARRNSHGGRRPGEVPPDFLSNKIYFVKLILPFLSINDNPTRLLGVCKEWQLKLEKPIFEFYLIHNHMLMNDTIRLKI